MKIFLSWIKDQLLELHVHAELITARGETATKSKVSDLLIANSLAIFIYCIQVTFHFSSEYDIRSSVKQKTH